jgi:alpha-glucosidase
MNRLSKLCITVFAAVFLTISSFAFQALPSRLLSPDKKILYEFDIRNGRPGYRISYLGRNLIDFSILNPVTKRDSPGREFRLVKSVRLDSAEQYTLFTGRSSEVNDPFQQLTLFLGEKNKNGIALIVQVRAFNDGIAFRYQFPKTDADSLFLIQEKSDFQIAGNPFVHALVLADYLSSHEGNYLHRYYQDLPKDSLMDMPILLEYPGKIYMAITEAALLDYAGMYLVKTGSGLVSNLSPLPRLPPWFHY